MSSNKAEPLSVNCLAMFIKHVKQVGNALRASEKFRQSKNIKSPPHAASKFISTK